MQSEMGSALTCKAISLVPPRSHRTRRSFRSHRFPRSVNSYLSACLFRHVSKSCLSHQIKG